MTWTITLPYPKPPKGLSLNDRCHWATKAENTALIRRSVKHLAYNAGIPKMQRMQVELVWVVKDRRTRDSDNTAPLLKAVADGLASNKGVSANLVPDDSPDYCVKLMPRIEYQPGSTPHFEVIISDISHRPDDITGLIESRNL